MIATPVAVDIPLRVDAQGKIRVGGTRVLLELVIRAFQNGESAEGIVESYPTLKLADVYAVLAYYLAQRADVDVYMRQVDQAADRIQREIEANYTPETLALRARLRPGPTPLSVPSTGQWVEQPLIERLPPWP